MLIPSIYVDLDDVVAETLRAFSALANQLYGTAIEFEDIFSFDLGQSFGLSEAELRRFMHIAHSRDVIVDNVDANPDAISVLREWEALGTHITIVTGRPISTYTDTLDWLHIHNVPFQTLRFLRKYGRNDLGVTKMRPIPLRNLSRSSFLFSVEDSPKMAKYISEKVKMPVLLLEKPWNKRANTHHPLMTLCRDWSDVRIRGLQLLTENNRNFKAFEGIFAPP